MLRAKGAKTAEEETTSSVEAAVREIRRRSRKRYSAEEKVRIVLKGPRGERARSQSCAAAKVSTRICTTNGPGNFWKLATALCGRADVEESGVENKLAGQGNEVGRRIRRDEAEQNEIINLVEP